MNAGEEYIYIFFFKFGNMHAVLFLTVEKKQIDG